jgi:hypothetical protein
LAAAGDSLEEADRLGVAGCDRATSLELRGAAATRCAAALLDDAGEGAAGDGAAACVRVGCEALAVVDAVLLTNDGRWPDVEEVCWFGDCDDEDDLVP